jgi:hypothetical protein
VHWQRTFEARGCGIARETNRPIMGCAVNMDGEVGERGTGRAVRYRQEDTARLLEPYVCVIGSVYRHTPARLRTPRAIACSARASAA